MTIAAASDLSQALPELSRDYSERRKVNLVTTLGASGALAQQIENGAPYDVFLSADRKFAERLAGNGHIDPASQRVYAIGRLVLYSPALRVSRLEDLRATAVKRIAIANPDVAPYGRAAKQALERAGLWAEVKDKLVFAGTIRQTLEMADSGNVDVALTSLALVTGPSSAVEATLYDPILQTGGVVTRPGAHPQARDFLDYLGTPEARAILHKYKFDFIK